MQAKKMQTAQSFSTGNQQQISALIRESFALHKESKRLLAEAKAMVEREIEKEINIEN